jgi:hypothetical protein
MMALPLAFTERDSRYGRPLLAAILCVRKKIRDNEDYKSVKYQRGAWRVARGADRFVGDEWVHSMGALLGS